MSPQVALDVIVRRQEAALARRVEELTATKAAAAAAVAALDSIAAHQGGAGVERLVLMSNTWRADQGPSASLTDVSDGVYMFPASFAQARMWFLAQMSTGSLHWRRALTR